MFYTYLHRRPDTNEVFYIGKGFGRRATIRAGRNRPWHQVVRDAGGFFLTEVLAHWSTEAEAFEHEKFLIACFRDLGAPLCNQSPGGEGWKHGPGTAMKISESKRGKPMSDAHRAALTGKKRSPESRERMRQAQIGKRKGVPLTEAHKAAIAEARRGKPHPHQRKG